MANGTATLDDGRKLRIRSTFTFVVVDTNTTKPNLKPYAAYRSDVCERAVAKARELALKHRGEIFEIHDTRLVEAKAPSCVFITGDGREVGPARRLGGGY